MQLVSNTSYKINMKRLNKWTSALGMLLLIVALFAIPSIDVDAAPSAKALKKAVQNRVRIMPYDDYTSSGSNSSTDIIYVPYMSKENRIANIKVSNKALHAKQTYYYSQTGELGNQFDYKKTFPNYGCIALYSEREGKYTVSFDVLSKKGGKKVYSKKVTVFVKADEPIKYVKYAGKKLEYNTVASKMTGKLSVKMGKGYKLKSIRIGKYQITTNEDKTDESSYGTFKRRNLDGEAVYSKVKNNKNITLSDMTMDKYQSTYESIYDGYHSYYSNMRDGILAETIVEVTYIDKYTKTPTVAAYSIYYFAK